MHHHRLDPTTGTLSVPQSEVASVKSSSSTRKGKGSSIKSGGEDAAANKPLSLSLAAADLSTLSLAGKSVASSSTGVGEEGVRVVFLVCFASQLLGLWSDVIADDYVVDRTSVSPPPNIVILLWGPR